MGSTRRVQHQVPALGSAVLGVQVMRSGRDLKQARPRANVKDKDGETNPAKAAQ